MFSSNRSCLSVFQSGDLDSHQRCMKCFCCSASLSALGIAYSSCFNHFGAHELFTDDYVTLKEFQVDRIMDLCVWLLMVV